MKLTNRIWLWSAFVFVWLVIYSVKANADQEINISYSHINQDLEFDNRIEFDMPSVSLSYSYFTDMGLGIELAISRSTDAPNTIKLNTEYTNKINALWSLSGVYKYKLNDDFSFKVGAGITEYHSTWTVNGTEPAWSKGTDSHKPSWFIGFQYRLIDNLYLEGSRRFMYEKMKEDKGREVTYSHNIGLTYLF